MGKNIFDNGYKGLSIKKIALIFLLLPFSIFAQNQKEVLPSSLKECNILLDELFKTDEKLKIKNSIDPGIMSEYHMGIGLYIRNNWIRHGNPLLVEQINYRPWKVGIDDIGSVILLNYWYYLHNQNYNWDKVLANSEKYYASYKEPADFPAKVKLRKQNSMYVMDIQEYSEMIQVYKEIDSENYYLYSHTFGWIKLNSEEFKIFDEAKNKLDYFKDDRSPKAH